jgi:hypothetical protein
MAIAGVERMGRCLCEFATDTPSASTEAPAPDGVTVTTKVTQIEICAPETETIPAVTYWLGINDDGVLSVTDGCGCGVTMSPAAARAIGAELIRMGGE